MKKLQGMSFFWQLCMLFHMEYLGNFPSFSFTLYHFINLLDFLFITLAPIASTTPFIADPEAP